MILIGKIQEKRNAESRKLIQKKNVIKKKMGKPVFFTLTHCSKKLKGVTNKYCYKANMHKLCFNASRFYNVKYQASIITNCNFKGANIIGVDFFNSNLKGTSFKNAILENVVFFNCNLKNVEFSGASFNNVIFICTDLKCAKNLNVDNPKIKIMRTYKRLALNEFVKSDLLQLADNESIFHTRVLHVNKGKLNHWVLNIIYSLFGNIGIETLVKILPKKERWENMYTVFSYILLIEKLSK